MDLGRFELCLKVVDLVASREFYEKLGFEVVWRDEEDGWIILKNPTVTLALCRDHIKSNILNFRGQDIFALSAALTEKGLVFEKPAEVEADGSVGAWLKDPDGNLIYFNTAPAEGP